MYEQLFRRIDDLAVILIEGGQGFHKLVTLVWISVVEGLKGFVMELQHLIVGNHTQKTAYIHGLIGMSEAGLSHLIAGLERLDCFFVGESNIQYIRVGITYAEG